MRTGRLPNPIPREISGNNEKILVRGVNWLGDAVMTTPALLRLREARPRARITLLSPSKLGELWTGHPALDAVLTFDSREGPWALSRRLRAECFDLALVLPNSTRSALEPFLGRISSRIGYGGRGRELLLTHVVEHRPGSIRMRKRSAAEVRRLVAERANQTRTLIPEAAHHIFQYLHLAAVLGADPRPMPPMIRVDPVEVDRALARFSIPRDTPGRPLCGLNPAAEYGPAKRWPKQRFLETAIELQRRTRCRWILFGGPGDAALGNEFVEHFRAQAPAGEGEAGRGFFNVSGKTGLRELCALLNACRLLLTNDTGPMHVAAAVGTRVVVPFGSTSPELTGPGLPGEPSAGILRRPVACSPCFRRECPIDFRCMTGIPVEEAVERCMAFM
jgi:heptosyltransferase-2